MRILKWREIRGKLPKSSLYERVLEVGMVIETARGLTFADEWPNHVRDWLLQRDPTLQPDDVGYVEVLEALHALEYIGGER